MYEVFLLGCMDNKLLVAALELYSEETETYRDINLISSREQLLKFCHLYKAFRITVSKQILELKEDHPMGWALESANAYNKRRQNGEPSNYRRQPA